MGSRQEPIEVTSSPCQHYRDCGNFCRPATRDSIQYLGPWCGFQAFFVVLG